MESFEIFATKELITSRLALAKFGATQQTMFWTPDLPSAPLRTPPIANGMTATMEALKEILLSTSSSRPEDLTRVPNLLRRIRTLLRVYYDALITKRQTSNFRFCDVQNLSDVGLALHEMGLTVMYSPSRLRSLVYYAPDIETFLFDEPLDIGKWRTETHNFGTRVQQDTESDPDDKMLVMDATEKAGNDLAAYQMSFFVGDLLVGLVAAPPQNAEEHRRAERAMAKIVEYSTSLVYRAALGDAFTDALQPIYMEKRLTTRFAAEGGLPALIDDWAMSISKDLCKKAIDDLPSRAWGSQTPETLQGIFRGLMHVIEVDGEEVSQTPLFARIMHEIYSRYGLKPFERAATIRDETILFYFLHRRISRKPSAYKSPEAMLTLLQKFANVPRATRKRHSWILLSIAGRWECLDAQFGCGNPTCPEKADLLKLREKRQRGVRDPIIEERLYKWGACKACAKTVSYCSTSCQRGHWKEHKLECKKTTPQQRTQMEVEI